MAKTYLKRRLEMIRDRSYALWEHEGRLEGRADEYWLRAESEVEAECRAAIEGNDANVVLPLPQISRRPIRRAAAGPGDVSRSAAA